jgi:integrase
MVPGRKPLLESELPRVYAALANFPLRDRTLVTLGLNTGFRIKELLSLNVGHVWEDTHVRSHIRVTRAKLKGGKGRRKKTITSRTVPLNETATLILQKYLFARFGPGPMKLEEALFPSRMHGKRINRCRANVIVHEVLERAGFENLDAYGTHSLRKGFCQAIYRITNHDLNLTRAIRGHADCSTTQKYLFVDEAEMQNAVLNLSRRRTSSPRLYG